MEYVDKELSSPRFKDETAPQYISFIRDFIYDNVASKIADARRKHGMYDALEREDEWDEYTDLSLGASGTSSISFRTHSF